jgi:hypothetical protein
MALFVRRFYGRLQRWLAERGLGDCDLHADALERETSFGEGQGLVLVFVHLLNAGMLQEVLDQLRKDLIIYVAVQGYQERFVSPEH